jgi:ABC-type multidrug transport system ATPase subunit
MDAMARQALRTLLRRAKQNTALLLTTHFMDEADVLSDEVVVLAAGRLACHGPSLALKAMQHCLVQL